jgi:hypothetical protein
MNETNLILIKFGIFSSNKNTKKKLKVKIKEKKTLKRKGKRIFEVIDFKMK